MRRTRRLSGRLRGQVDFCGNAGNASSEGGAGSLPQAETGQVCGARGGRGWARTGEAGPAKEDRKAAADSCFWGDAGEKWAREKMRVRDGCCERRTGRGRERRAGRKARERRGGACAPEQEITPGRGVSPRANRISGSRNLYPQRCCAGCRGQDLRNMGECRRGMPRESFEFRRRQGLL